ncbi:MAG: homocysteine S-methyltransferase family protein [Kiritimatiellia bacterium]
MRKPLLDALASHLLCCDGAMGTQLMARGMSSGECGMLWNVNRAADVRAVHDAYRSAGCDLITTNSFGGSASVLGRHGRADQVRDLNMAAARLARESAGEDAWVLGDVGPFGDFLEPLGDMTPEELRPIFQAQIEALLAGGADAILVETMVDPAEAVVGIEAAKLASPHAPVIATYAFQKPAPGVFRTIMGTTVAEAVERAVAAGADIVGANCGTGLDLDDYVLLAGQLVAAAGTVPVILQPNAAPRRWWARTPSTTPPRADGGHRAAPDGGGVRIIGGCCGTTPAHLKAMAATVHAG